MGSAGLRAGRGLRKRRAWMAATARSVRERGHCVADSVPTENPCPRQDPDWASRGSIPKADQPAFNFYYA